MKRPEQSVHTAIYNGLRAALPPEWLVVHVPNGGHRTLVEGAILKSLGTTAGFPDLMILGEAEWGCTAWFLEVKADGGRVTDRQRDFHERLRNLGFPVAVVHSWEEALTACRQWRIPLRVVGYGGRNVA